MSSKEPRQQQQQQSQRRNSNSRRSSLVLDTPEGLEYLAKLIQHHRRDFLLANLTQQAAMIRFIREHLVAAQGFADPHGDPLDDDAIALGIAKVFYLYTDEEDQIPEPEAAAATTTAVAAAAASASLSHHHHVHFMEQEDCQMYEYLTHLRHHSPAVRISPSPTPAAVSPKLGPKAAAVAAAAAAVPSKPPAKRKSSSSGGKNSSSSSTDKKSKKNPHNAEANGNHHAKTASENGDATLSLNSEDNDSNNGGAEAADGGTIMPLFPTRQELSARAMELLQETQAVPDIPKGVTVRPSGRWQSQVYYNGASRYLGVYSDSNEAAMAWIIAKQILTETNDRGAPKTEKDKWYAAVRDVVTLTVQGAQTGQALHDA